MRYQVHLVVAALRTRGWVSFSLMLSTIRCSNNYLVVVVHADSQPGIVDLASIKWRETLVNINRYPARENSC
jgi:hypothetical protein